ncbi:hypothetical protein, partial [Limosilactobacillus reuteri]|uniref:hypothetical protein n=2 Tax=Lactobacillales TaxID=186826 RepID=UPI001CDCF15F
LMHNGRKEIQKMGQETKRDRLSAYVESDTTSIIEQIQKEQKELHGVRFTIGQAVDYLATQYKKSN